MSRPTKLPSGRVVWAAYDYDWFDNEATKEEKEMFLEYLDMIAEAAEAQIKKRDTDAES